MVRYIDVFSTSCFAFMLGKFYAGLVVRHDLRGGQFAGNVGHD